MRNYFDTISVGLNSSRNCARDSGDPNWKTILLKPYFKCAILALNCFNINPNKNLINLTNWTVLFLKVYSISNLKFDWKC